MILTYPNVPYFLFCNNARSGSACRVSHLATISHFPRNLFSVSATDANTNTLWASGSTWLWIPFHNLIKRKQEADRTHFFQSWSAMQSNRNKAPLSVGSQSVTAVQDNDCRHHIHAMTLLYKLSWIPLCTVHFVFVVAGTQHVKIRFPTCLLFNVCMQPQVRTA